MAMTAEERRRRKRDLERDRRADPKKGATIRAGQARRYADGGRERQRAYYDRLRREQFFLWRARLWSSRHGVKVTEQELRDLWAAQDGCCALSDRPLGNDAHLDHITPAASGGGHTIENLRWLDPAINIARSTLSDADFIQLCADVLRHSLTTTPTEQETTTP